MSEQAEMVGEAKLLFLLWAFSQFVPCRQLCTGTAMGPVAWTGTGPPTAASAWPQPPGGTTGWGEPRACPVSAGPVFPSLLDQFNHSWTCAANQTGQTRLSFSHPQGVLSSGGQIPVQTAVAAELKEPHVAEVCWSQRCPLTKNVHPATSFQGALWNPALNLALSWFTHKILKCFSVSGLEVPRHELKFRLGWRPTSVQKRASYRQQCC